MEYCHCMTSGLQTPSTAGAAAGEETRRSRYQVIERDGERCLTCSVQTVLLHVVRGLSVNETGRKRYPEQTIFLDGVFGGPPFYDNKARQYSLDHHAGCVRAFTLATCEQAVVVLLQGLPLGEGEWQLYVNEPDLDALLASWVLLNHLELLAEGGELLWRAMPLIRVEGVIDAHGLDMEILCGVPKKTYAARKDQLDRLLADERRHKGTGSWATIDFLDYARGILEAIDAQLFPPSHLGQLLEIEEVKRLPLQGAKQVILCRSHQNIYEVEALLKERHERQLGLIVLDRGGGRFTLRQVDPFLSRNLLALYAALNQRDSRASHHGGIDNLWGGSEDIGGSPRATGSALTGDDILRQAQQVYGAGGWFGKLVQRLRP
jgi:hypothetical protein